MTRDEQVLQLLWPDRLAASGAQLYAVLDGARDRRIHRMVAASELDWRCLYAGDLPAELREVAPYLAHMRPDAQVTHQTISAGWGRAWGIWLVSAAPFEQLRRHLRRFLRVQDPQGRRLLFRYYDPVVLATFLPTCTERELAELFGPIDAFVIEAEADAGAGAGDGPAITEFRFDGFTLQVRSRGAAGYLRRTL